MQGKLEFKKWLKPRDVDHKTIKSKRLTTTQANTKPVADNKPINTGVTHGLDEV